jgi:hypothetical protein
MKKWFEYHCYEGEDSCDAELWHHTHQQVKVIGKPELVEEMEDGHKITTVKVRFSDGLEYDVFDDELLDSPQAFERPDYEPLAPKS